MHLGRQNHGATVTGTFPGTVDQMLAAAALRVIVAQTPWLTELRPADPFELRMCANNYHIYHDGGHDPMKRTTSCICCPATRMPARATSASIRPGCACALLGSTSFTALQNICTTLRSHPMEWASDLMQSIDGLDSRRRAVAEIWFMLQSIECGLQAPLEGYARICTSSLVRGHVGWSVTCPSSGSLSTVSNRMPRGLVIGGAQFNTGTAARSSN
jgi:hypothetical protein